MPAWQHGRGLTDPVMVEAVADSVAEEAAALEAAAVEVLEDTVLHPSVVAAAEVVAAEEDTVLPHSEAAEAVVVVVEVDMAVVAASNVPTVKCRELTAPADVPLSQEIYTFTTLPNTSRSMAQLLRSPTQKFTTTLYL